ncbi:unnamed protein product [Closterium sp. Naga37s-1]|nr:unnamed protein product [Closterium sp. Naga37s-1]
MSQLASDTSYGRERVGDSAACGAATDTTTPHGAATDAVPVVAVEESSVSTALGTATYVTATCRVSIGGPTVSVSAEAGSREKDAAAAAAAAAVKELAARLGGSPSVVTAFVSGGGASEGGASEAGASTTGAVLESLGRGGEGSTGGENIPFFGCVVGGSMQRGPWGGEGEIMGETHTGGGHSDAHGIGTGSYGRNDADGDVDGDGEGEGEALEWEEVVMAAAADEVIEGVVLLELIEDSEHIIREMAAFLPHEGRQHGEEDTGETGEMGETGETGETGEAGKENGAQHWPSGGWGGEEVGGLNSGQFGSAASDVAASSALPAPPFTEPSNSFAESIRAITEGHVAQAEGAVTQRLEAASRRLRGLAERLQTRLEAPQYKLEGLADSIQERMWPSNGIVQGNELLLAKAAVFSRGDGVTERLEGRGGEEQEVEVVVVCAAVMPGVDCALTSLQSHDYPFTSPSLHTMLPLLSLRCAFLPINLPLALSPHLPLPRACRPSLQARHCPASSPACTSSSPTPPGHRCSPTTTLSTCTAPARPRPHTTPLPASASPSAPLSSVAASSTTSHVPRAHVSILVHLPSLLLLSTSPQSPFPRASSPASSLPAPAEQQSSDALQACFTHFIRHLTLPLTPATTLHASSPPAPATAPAALSLDMPARGIAPPAPWLRVKEGKGRGMRDGKMSGDQGCGDDGLGTKEDEWETRRGERGGDERRVGEDEGRAGGDEGGC